MKLTKHIRYLVRVRDYETVQVEVGAEADHHDLGLSDEDWTALDAAHRRTYTDHLELLIIEEVERLATEELQQVNQWSDISPNLAEDFLLAQKKRSQNGRANTKADTPSSSRRVRPGGRSPTSPPAA